MARNYIGPGKNLTAIAGSGGVLSGTLQVIGTLFGMAVTSAAQGKEYELETGGLWEAPKPTSQAWAMGAAIYYDATAKNFTTTAGSNLKVGVAAQSAGSADAIGMVRLNSNF